MNSIDCCAVLSVNQLSCMIGSNPPRADIRAFGQVSVLGQLLPLNFGSLGQERSVKFSLLNGGQ